MLLPRLLPGLLGGIPLTALHHWRFLLEFLYATYFPSWNVGIYGQCHERYCFVTLTFNFKVTGGLLKVRFWPFFHILAQCSYTVRPSYGKFSGYFQNHKILPGSIFGLLLKNKMAARDVYLT